MIVYRQFLDSPGKLQIEVDEGGSGPPAGGGYARTLAEALQALVSSTGEELIKLPPEQRPSEMEVTCGLIALGSGGFAIARSSDTTSFHVSMRWSFGGAASEYLDSLPNLPDLAPE